MTLCVIPQITFPVKGLPAYFTAVRRQAGRLGLLFLRLRHLWAPRLLALVLRLAGVTPAVRERLPAAPTGEPLLTSVDLLVAPERSGSREAFVADVAAVWLDSCVTPHVHLHVLESLTADSAGAAGVPVMLQVSQQSTR